MVSVEIVKGCTVQGKEIKDTIFSSSGILVYDCDKLMFIDPQSLNVKEIKCNVSVLRRIIFISNEFEFIKLLDPNETYELEFNNEFLVFKSKDTIELVIMGIIL